MAGTSLLTLLDDIATVLDDVSVMTKVAAKKTSGVLGDDLALNAEQVTGVSAKRELPVIWAVAKGGMLNKALLVPAALAISAFLPWAIVPLLMLGGLFLCYEGFHKVYHKLFHHAEEKAEKAEVVKAARDPKVDLVAFEKKKIKGAIRTDFILSAEVIVIALGVASEEPFVVQLGVLSTIAILMNVAVYGLVAGIVKLDDAGIHLVNREGTGGIDALLRRFGDGILAAAPWLMRGLGIVGTAAMFLVGGGIIAHGIGPIEHAIEAAAEMAGPADFIVPTLLNGLLGVIAGGILVAIISAGTKVYEAATSK